MIEKPSTIASGAAISAGVSVKNGVRLFEASNMYYPVGVRCPDALTTDTTFAIEYQVDESTWSELKDDTGQPDSKLFSANGTVLFTSIAASLLKDRTIRVKVTTNQGADRTFTFLYAVL